MKEFRLSKELSESIVDGIIEGYKDYLSVRREKARELINSWCLCVGKRESY